MSQKSDYTSKEWQLLLDAPLAVGTAVMHAGRSGVGSVKEAMTMASSVLNVGDGYEGNELIEALVRGRVDDGDKSVIETMDSPYRGLEPDEILQDAVDKCRAVVQLLDSKSNALETDGYLDWTLDVGIKVAKAAKEGGFLGFGGERVSQEEQRAINAIRKAFG